MNRPDWVGEWFPILESQGEFVQITFGKITSQSTEPQWQLLPHRQFDGYGGLNFLLDGTNLQAPAVSSRTTPSVFSKIKGFLHFLVVSKIDGVKWKTYSFDRSGKQAEVAWSIFSEDETQALIAQAETERVSLNSLLLSKIDHALGRLWTDSASARRWLIPVDMRAFVKNKTPHSNHSSYVSVSIRDQTSLRETKKLVKDELLKNSHWGAWWVVNSGRFIGHFGMKKMMESIRKKKLCWMGTLSNLGVWKSEDPQTTWFFCPPVLVTQPISLGCLIWNNRLTLTLQFHPALNEDPAKTWHSLEACKTEILRGCL